MGYNKSSKYANIACTLFILYAVVNFATSVVSIYIDSGIGTYRRDEEDIAYFIVSVFSVLIYPVICIITAYMLKKRKKLAILWLAIFAAKNNIDVSSGEYSTYVSFDFAAIGWLLTCIALVIFVVMLFAAAYNKNKIVSKLFVLPATLYIPGTVCKIFSVLMICVEYNSFGYAREKNWGLLDYLERFKYLDFSYISNYLPMLIRLLLCGIIGCALLLLVGLYLKKSSTVGEKQDNIRPVEVIGSAEKIKEYKDMLDSGIITQDEFDSIKKQLL